MKATSKQIAYINKLSPNTYTAEDMAKLTKKTASELIEAILGTKGVRPGRGDCTYIIAWDRLILTEERLFSKG